MPIAIGFKREYEFTGADLNGDPCIFPRCVSNHIFVQAFNFKTKNIVMNDAYTAFPYVTKTQSGAIVGICSNGDAHASSDRQILFTSIDGGLTFTVVEDFYTAATQAFNLTYLTSLLQEGEVITLKVWNFKKFGGAITYTTTSTVINGADTWAIWSRPKSTNNGKLYRTGYKTGGVTALLESTDGGMSWQYKSTIFSEVGKLFNEADIVNTTPDTWIAYCRADGEAGNPLYKSVSTDNGATWSAATIVDVALMDGRQPNLTKLSDGSIILATGDRSGASGYTANGQAVQSLYPTTGITIFRSTDNGITWSFRTRISPIYSTDGGQPFVVETAAGRVFCAFYVRRNINEKPIISSCSFDVSNL